MFTCFSVISFMFMVVHVFYNHGVCVFMVGCVCHVFVSVHAFHVVHVHVFHVHVDSCFPWSLWFMFSMVMVVHVSFTCWSFMIFRGILVHDGLIMRHGGRGFFETFMFVHVHVHVFSMLCPLCSWLSCS